MQWNERQQQAQRDTNSKGHDVPNPQSRTLSSWNMSALSIEPWLAAVAAQAAEG
jgi:hypothetical protein